MTKPIPSTPLFHPPLSEEEQKFRERYARYKVGDVVMVHTAHLKAAYAYLHPHNGETDLYLHHDMIAASGRVAIIQEVLTYRYGDFYILDITSQFLYTTDFLRSVDNLNNQQLSTALLDRT